MGFIFGIPQGNPEKELPWGLWVGFRVLAFRVFGLASRVEGLGASGFGFGVPRLGFRVEGLGSTG